MSQFFQPIEATHKIPTHFDLYQVEKYNDDPFEVSYPKIQSLGDHRRKIINWLKSMPVSVRIQKLTYTNKQFATLIIKMFQYMQEGPAWNQNKLEFIIGYHNIQGYVINQPRMSTFIDENILASEKKLLSQIVIVNCFTRFDSITVSQSLAADVDKMFDIFSIIQNGVSHELTQNNYKMYESTTSPLMFFHPKEYLGEMKSLCSWFVEVIKKTVSLNYFNTVNYSHDHPSPSLQEFSIMYVEKAKKMKKFWKNLSNQARTRIVNHIFSMDIYNIVNDHRQNIKVSDYSFPKIRFSDPKDIQQFKLTIIGNSETNQSQQIFSKLTFSSLSSTLQSLATFKYELLIEIELMMERQEKSLLMVKKKSKKSDQPEQKKQQKNNKVKKIEFTYGEAKKNDTFQNGSQKTLNSSFISQNQEQSTKSTITIKNTLETKNQPTSKNNYPINNPNNKFMPKKIKSQQKKKVIFTHFPKEYNEHKNNQIFPYVQEESSEEQNKNLAIQRTQESKCENQFNKILTQLSQKANSSKKLKKLAINRISCILEAYNLSYKIFGSYNYGLSLPNSDIDFCIDPTIVHYFYGSFCSYRQKITMALNFLKNIFSQHLWAKNMNLITTATVPLLAFDVDLNIFVQEQKHGTYNPPKPIQNKNQQFISIDLTIEPFANMIEEVPAHLGYESTGLIKEWLVHYENLSSMVLIFKYIFSKFNLNKAFTGGISSFSLIIWIVGFLQLSKGKQLQQKKIIKQCIIKFCRTFAEFGDKTCLVDIRGEQPVVFLAKKNEKQFSSKLVIVSPLNNKNLTESCHKLSQIQLLLTNIANTLENKRKKGHKQYKKILRNFFFD